MRLYSGYRYKNCECIPLEAKVALWLLQRIFLIAGPRIRTREVPYAAHRVRMASRVVPR
jgi:hypothetical protein